MNHKQIVFVDLNPTQGREQANIRPCVIVSVDKFNNSGAELIQIVPLTSQLKNIPDRVLVKPSSTNALSKDSHALPAQFRTISQSRVTRETNGFIEDELLDEILDHIRKNLGI